MDVGHVHVADILYNPIIFTAMTVLRRFLLPLAILLCACAAYGSTPECIDYADLTSPDVVCTYIDMYDMVEHTEMVDSGPQSEKSLHTVHTQIGERDPYVQGLMTIPPGFPNSVRVGGYIAGKFASVTYTMRVPQGADMSLIVRYAIVHESPGHFGDANPKFTLQILDADDEVIDSACAMVEYTAGDNTQAWETENNIRGEYIWNNWEAVGFNLQPYAGDTVKLKLISKPCDAGSHVSYAYFVTECVDNRMEGIGCGTEATRFEAPEGFDYLWYSSDDAAKTPLGYERTFDVPQGGGGEYSVDVISKKDPECSFTITASAQAHYPKAEATWEWTSERCENEMTFHNGSYMYTLDGSDTVRREALTECEWDFGEYGRSTDTDPVVLFPTEGDTIDAVLTVMRDGDEECMDVLPFRVAVPAIVHDTVRETMELCGYVEFVESDFKPGDTITMKETDEHGCETVHIAYVVWAVTDTVDSAATICAGDVFDFYGEPLTEAGVHLHGIKYAGRGECDSVVVRLALSVIEPVYAEAEAVSICEGDEYDFNGKKLTEAGLYHDTVRTVAGCDSVIYTLDLSVTELDVDIPARVEACADSGVAHIPFTANGADIVSYRMEFGSAGVPPAEGDVEGDAVAVQLPDSLRPGIYEATLTLVERECGEKALPVELAVQYPAGIVRQKWNNVLAVLNENYNGGYRFDTFQWYKDGVLLDGEYSPVLYIPYGQLDTASYYQVEMMRVGDGAILKCCPVWPVHKDEAQFAAAPTVLSGGGVVHAVSSGSGVARLYTSGGARVADFDLQPGDNRLPMPTVSGVYLLSVELDGGYRAVEKIVVM